MGYHVILDASEEKYETQYIEDLRDLVDIPSITENSIIYQGEPEWVPKRIGDSEEYGRYVDPKFRAGIAAERLFEKMIKQHGFAFERIEQGSKSFEKYTSIADRWIKRGDFIVRNASNVEVEVKCLKKYPGDKYYLQYSDYKGHKGMENIISSKVVLAFYSRANDRPQADSLAMVALSTIGN